MHVWGIIATVRSQFLPTFNGVLLHFTVMHVYNVFKNYIYVLISKKIKYILEICFFIHALS